MLLQTPISFSTPAFTLRNICITNLKTWQPVPLQFFFYSFSSDTILTQLFKLNRISLQLSIFWLWFIPTNLQFSSPTQLHCFLPRGSKSKCNKAIFFLLTCQDGVDLPVPPLTHSHHLPYSSLGFCCPWFLFLAIQVYYSLSYLKKPRESSWVLLHSLGPSNTL